MCGITGFWQSRPRLDAPADVLRAMSGAIRHRGPDDEGVWFDAASGVGLGHRRLSIVDLSAHGHQPKPSRSGRFIVAFNGEIYNFTALREQLRARGQHFAGTSDTEVLLAGLEEWGPLETARRCDGMFAFAAWDAAEQELWLCRDRMGEKPLYYGWAGNDLVFASELKALRRYPAWQPAVDPSSVADLLHFGFVPAPASIYENVHKLPPGTAARFRHAANATPTIEPYWTLQGAVDAGRQDPVRGTDDEMLGAVDSVLRDVIASEMVADVPVGAFLSGGIDSSLVVAIMQALSSRPVRTFTIGFHERAYDEATYAKAVARHLGTEHTELYVSPAQAQAVIPRLPSLYDEPFADSSQIPTFLVAELARRDVTVSLSGDGGDELFGGYNRHILGNRLSALPKPVRSAAARAVRTLSPAQWDALSGAAARVLPTRLRVPAAGDKAHKLAEVLAADSSALYTRLITHWPRTIVHGDTRRAAIPALDGGAHPVARMMYTDTLLYLPDDILVKVDRASMGVSLESRAPFLHHRMVELAWRLPMRAKLRGGRGKWALRALLERYVPRELTDRPKTGFGVPIGAWLRGPLRDWAEALLDEGALAAHGLLDTPRIRERWLEHVSGRRNWHYLLWCVLMFQAWYADQQ
ncbi:MAG TPA: asparagine synthase (glutamine-hydrolyzing) [Gemmatimonadaceae bacterium]|nr:asparagine synthase (glutamine-hydrolyzing) [Gemmatimonadaceae bacterium]